MGRWDKIKTRFDLLAGIIGFIVDTITILGMIGVSHILPSISNTAIIPAAFDSLLLILQFQLFLTYNF